MRLEATNRTTHLRRSQPGRPAIQRDAIEQLPCSAGLCMHANGVERTGTAGSVTCPMERSGRLGRRGDGQGRPAREARRRQVRDDVCVGLRRVQMARRLPEPSTLPFGPRPTTATESRALLLNMVAVSIRELIRGDMGVRLAVGWGFAYR